MNRNKLQSLPSIVLGLVIVAVGASESEAQPQADRIRKLDTNGDEALSQEEAGDQFWKRISKRDANGDGKLTLAEIRNRGGKSNDNETKPTYFKSWEAKDYDEKQVKLTLTEADKFLTWLGWLEPNE